MRAGDTPLIDAVRHGRVAEVVALLAASDGADVDLTTKHGRTALYIACQEGHTEIALKLIAANAEVNQARNNGITAVGQACGCGEAAA